MVYFCRENDILEIESSEKRQYGLDMLQTLVSCDLLLNRKVADFVLSAETRSDKNLYFTNGRINSKTIITNIKVTNSLFRAPAKSIAIRAIIKQTRNTRVIGKHNNKFHRPHETSLCIRVHWNNVYIACTIVEYMILTAGDGFYNDFNNTNNKERRFDKDQKI